MLSLFKKSGKIKESHSLSLSNGETIKVKLRRNKAAKRLILRMDPTGPEVVVTLPHHATEIQALRFVDQQQMWIENQLAKSAAVVMLDLGASLPIEGVIYEVCHDPARRHGVTFDEDEKKLYVAGASEHIARRLKDHLKKMARERLQIQVDLSTEKLEVKHRKITIRDTKSRWGSCSTSGNLNFSWRLILAPPSILNYVAIHEVAHIREHNHSPAFWAWVTFLDPDWKTARNWLRKHGAELHRYQ